MNQETREHTDVWVKWDWLWSAIFFAAITISALLLIFEYDGRLQDIWLPLLLTLALPVWHWGGLRLAYRNTADWEERPLPRLIVILGDILLWFILVNFSPAYYFVLLGLFSQIFRHLPLRYAIFATILLTAAIIIEQTGDSDAALSFGNPLFWVFFSMGAAGIILGVWISAIINQSTRRRELIEQLEAAQAELAAAERREGVLEERQRLAREIHDTLAQGFTSIVMLLEAAEQALPDDLTTLQKHLDQARRTARTSLDQARRVVEDLRPDLLEQHSLLHAIERASARWSDASGIPVDLNATGEPADLHPDVEVILLRAAQEALNNIRKHAQAGEVCITLSYMPELVILDIQDDGVGLNGAEPSSFAGGFGLKAMQERVAQFGGSALIESEPGEGATLVVSIPIDADK